MINIALSIALVASTVGIVSAAIAIIYESVIARRAASSVWPIAWVAMLAAIVAEGVEQGRFPLTNISEYLLVLAWAMLSLHVFAWYRQRVWVAGLVLPPISLIALVVAWNLLPVNVTEPSVNPRGLFVVHTTLSTLGIAALGLAFTMSVIYLIQDRGLKSKRRLSVLQRLPALGTCELLGYHALIVGFILLSLGMGAGVLMNANLHDRLWVPGFKQLFAALAWVVFAAVIVSRAAVGFRGRKSAYLTIAGFVLGLLTVFGMTL